MIALPVFVLMLFESGKVNKINYPLVLHLCGKLNIFNVTCKLFVLVDAFFPAECKHLFLLCV